MSLIKNFLSVGAATMASRVLGFFRDILLAANLGTGPVNDAFVVAFKLPNLFRRLFAEGAFNSAFVPLYARALEEGGEAKAKAFAAEVFAGFLTVLLIFSGLAMIGAPLLVMALAPGFVEDQAKFDLTVLLTQICFPYLTCMSLMAMLAGIMNAHRKFFLAALAPVLLNVISVAALLGIAWAGYAKTREAGILLSTAIAFAGVAQVGLVAWGVVRGGYGFRFVRPRWTPDMRRLVRLGIPGVIAGGVTQINIVVGTIIASMEAGAVSYLYYADRIYQLPLGIVGVAIGVVLLPEIARHVRGGRPDLAARAQNRSLEFACLLTLPAAVALVVLAHPIIEVLFERGAFTAADTAKTAAALAAYGAGLTAFVLIKVFSPAFFGREDTTRPMVYSMISMVVNVVAALVLFQVWSHVGIAVATTLSGWVNAGLLWWALHRRGHWQTDDQAARRVPRLLVSALVMGVACWFAGEALTPWLAAERGFAVKFAVLGALCAGGAAVFFGVAHVIGGVDLKEVRGFLRRDRSRAAVPSETTTD